MSPQTRSRRGTPASAPVSRVYSASRPLQQAHFPARNRVIRTYGRRPATRPPKQQTLTQIDYLVPVDLDEMEDSRPQKRRKTAGDTPTSSSFHTQTLTQFVAAKAESDDDALQIKDSDDEDSLDALVPLETLIPQTPAHKRTKTEIPSSQPSPFTPMLGRYSMAPEQSPRKEKSTNTSARSPVIVHVLKSRERVIPDSYDTVPSSLGSNKLLETPTGRVPLRTLRSSQRSRKIENPSAVAVATTTTRDRQPLLEIPDSDDELDCLEVTPQKAVDDEDTEPGTPSPLPRASQKHHEVPKTSVPLQPAHEDFQDSPANKTSNSGAFSHQRQSPVITSSPQASETQVEETQVEETPPPLPRSRASSTTPIRPKQTPARTQFYSQGLESQRVSFDVIRDMGPLTDRTDIILSIYPEHVEKIANGTKDHEFRNYKIPVTVKRFWIYVTRPVCELRYMAVVSSAKEPGEIDSSSGVGNAQFNGGMKSKFAYALEQVYELNNPVSLQLMKKNGWMEGPPQKYSYVAPAIVGQLLANLRCALFEEAGDATIDMTVSQEVEEQIKSDIAHTDEHAPSEEETIIPSTQEPTATSTLQPAPGRTPAGAVRPSQTTTVSQPSWQDPSSEKSVPRPLSCSSLATLPDFVDNDSPLDLRSGPFLADSSQVVLPESLYYDVLQPPVIPDSDDEDE